MAVQYENYKFNQAYCLKINTQNKTASCPGVFYALPLCLVYVQIISFDSLHSNFDAILIVMKTDSKQPIPEAVIPPSSPSLPPLPPVTKHTVMMAVDLTNWRILTKLIWSTWLSKDYVPKICQSVTYGALRTQKLRPFCSEPSAVKGSLFQDWASS